MLSRELPISQPDEDDILGALVGRAKQGSAAAFTELAGRIRVRIRHWAARVVRDDDDADDVAQQVLLKVHLRIREFEGRRGSRFTTWLYRMTVNTALNRRRVERRRSHLLRGVSEPPSAVMADVATKSDEDHLAVLVRACITELSDREREVFQLADLKGMSVAQIAVALGVQPVTVRATLSRARRRIRIRMMEQHPHLLEDYDV